MTPKKPLAVRILLYLLLAYLATVVGYFVYHLGLFALASLWQGTRSTAAAVDSAATALVDPKAGLIGEYSSTAGGAAEFKVIDSGGQYSIGFKQTDGSWGQWNTLTPCTDDTYRTFFGDAATRIHAVGLGVTGGTIYIFKMAPGMLMPSGRACQTGYYLFLNLLLQGDVYKIGEPTPVTTSIPPSTAPPGNASPPAADPSPAAQASAPSTTGPEAAAPAPSAADTPSESSASPVAPPADWRSYDSAEGGFSVEYPGDWNPTVETRGDALRFRFNGPTPDTAIIVETGKTASQESPMASWRDMDHEFRSRFGDGYQLMSLHSSTLDTESAADWSFVLQKPGEQPVQKLDIGTTRADRGYALLLQAPPASFGQLGSTFDHVRSSFHFH